MRTFPAFDINWPEPPSDDTVDHLLAAVDDHQPTAVEPHALGVRVFFTDETQRDTALSAAHDRFPGASVTSLLVPDDNWAERSQAALRPVRIDAVIVAPPWTLDDARADAAASGGTPVIISIQPSMGFGTGHHQSTRLCLRLLQRHAAPGATVLDIGTGSGVLAIAATKLGAVRAVGVDVDQDALTSAAENVELNGADSVVLDSADITLGATPLLERHAAPDGFGLVFANITGAMLERYAAYVAATVAPGGVLITSGFQTHEVDNVAAAFETEGLTSLERVEEDTWVAAAFRR